MRNKIPDADGHGWRLWTHVRSGAMLDIQVSFGCDAYVTVPIPLDLARRIAQVPEIKLVPVEGAADIQPHWMRLMERMLSAGMTAERKASNIGSLYPNQRTPKPMRGAAVALWRRGLLGRIPVQSGSHYWLTAKGLDMLSAAAGKFPGNFPT
jgi:hypothetical protein